MFKVRNSINLPVFHVTSTEIPIEISNRGVGLFLSPSFVLLSEHGYEIISIYIVLE
jgi:hypothetical protein